MQAQAEDSDVKYWTQYVVGRRQESVVWGVVLSARSSPQQQGLCSPM